MNEFAFQEAIKKAVAAANKGADGESQIYEAILEYEKLMRTPREINNEDVQLFTERLSQARLIHSCMNCDHFNVIENPAYQGGVEGETCLLYKQRPPARVIAFSCPSWVEQLPF